MGRDSSPVTFVTSAFVASHAGASSRRSQVAARHSRARAPRSVRGEDERCAGKAFPLRSFAALTNAAAEIAANRFIESIDHSSGDYSPVQSALLRSAGSLRWRTEYELRRRPIGCGVRHGGLAWHSAAWQSRHGMWHATYEMQHAIYICTHSHKQNIARKMILPQERERLDEEKVQLQLRYSPILYYSSLYCLVANPKVPCRAMPCRSAALAP